MNNEYTITQKYINKHAENTHLRAKGYSPAKQFLNSKSTKSQFARVNHQKPRKAKTHKGVHASKFNI